MSERHTCTGVCREAHLHRCLRETPARVSSERHTRTGVCRYTCSPLAGDTLTAGQHLWGRETGEELPLSGRVSPSHTRQGAPAWGQGNLCPRTPVPRNKVSSDAANMPLGAGTPSASGSGSADLEGETEPPPSVSAEQRRQQRVQTDGPSHTPLTVVTAVGSLVRSHNRSQQAKQSELSVSLFPVDVQVGTRAAGEERPT